MIATVKSIHIRPLKSAAELKTARDAGFQEWPVGPYGFKWDHNWMVAREDGGDLVSQRLCPRMALIEPVYYWDGGEGGFLFRVPGDDKGVWVELKGVEGDRRQVTVHDSGPIAAIDEGDLAAQRLSDFLGLRVRLCRIAPESNRRSPGGARLAFQDGWQLHFTGEESIKDVNCHLPHPVGVDAFRPQLHVAGLEPYVEDWIRKAQIGEAVIEGGSRCKRCQMPDVDQEAGIRRPGKPVFRALLGYRARKDPKTGESQTYFGRRTDFTEASVGASVRVGDEVRVLGWEKDLPQLGSLISLPAA